MRVLDVHYLIANVVGCLHKIYERMAGVSNGAIGGGKLDDAELPGYPLVVVHLATEEAELALVAREVGRIGVFHDACQRAVRHDETALATPLEVVREQTEGVGVALEMYDVIPLLRRDAVARLRTDVVLKEQPIPLAEIGSYCRFAAVPKRRVAEVVGKAGGADDVAELGEMCAVEFWMIFEDGAADVVAEAATHAADLQTVSEAVVHEDAAGQGKHLSLVLQPSEGSGEDKAIVIALEFRAVVTPSLHLLLPKAFAG